MAFTAAEEDRILAIEKMLNDIQIAITNLASGQQLRQLSALKQKEIDSLTQRVESLESQITVLREGL